MYLQKQVLRSCSKWSGGIDVPENSIYRAMETAIEQAEHYVYIENQFFITNSGQSAKVPSNANVEGYSSLNANFTEAVTTDIGEYLKEVTKIGSGLGTDLLSEDIVKNKIGQALVERILRAHRFVDDFYFDNQGTAHRLNSRLFLYAGVLTIF